MSSQRPPVAARRPDRLPERLAQLLMAVLPALALLSPSLLLAQDKPSLPPAGLPTPPARPVELTPAQGPSPAVAAPAPTPPERPTELAPSPSPPPAAEMPSPPQRPPELSGEAILALKVQPPDDTACRGRLTSLGATFEALPPIVLGQCGAERPLKLSSLKGVAIEPAATVVCGAAEALARWTTEVQFASERDLGQPLTSLSVGSYECRGQNHSTDAKLSEHALANAIDVMGYGFSNRAPIRVGASAAGTPEASFQAVVQAKACGFFRTVLGPGSDAAHANHLHLDERERNAGHRLCQ
ncbi:extensin family protein [uncultured Methylobacterium sp.]|uniref:extensin-like domain-containing protein n=1 Tax=uncultured Methylobacterium sp. TaxID=157278 RepID=UPI0035CC512D